MNYILQLIQKFLFDTMSLSEDAQFLQMSSYDVDSYVMTL